MENLSNVELFFIHYALSLFRDKLKNDNSYKEIVSDIIEKISGLED